ncbi:MAG: ABC transporter ATP-binding protein [Bacteroidia bacterium]|nr:ABC transporter ATP-binding protein [Bacteroidia bacterium]
MQLRLHLQGVGHKYRSRWLFRHLSLELKSGTSWAIIGPNGAGKSSLLSLIAGYSSPVEGSISYYLDEKPVRVQQLSPYFFWQSPHVQPPVDFTVGDLLRDYQKQKAFNPSIFMSHMKGISLSMRIYELSSGMRQRLLIALVLSASTGLILLDEPTAFLDADHKAHIWGALQQVIQHPEYLLLCATNDPEEAAFFPHSLYLPSYQS